MKLKALQNLILLAMLSFLIGCGGASQKAEESSEAEASAETEATPAVETAAVPGIADGSYTISSEASTLEWKGDKLGGIGAHMGTVTLQEGSFNVSGGSITNGSFMIDMTSMACTDLAEDQEKHGKLIGHLKSDDFFSVEAHPTATFAIKSAEALEGDEGTHTITGDLTIKGITNEISFPATVTEEGGKVMVVADMAFDRSKWDIKYNSQSFFPDLVADKVISDEISIKFNLQAAPAGA